MPMREQNRREGIDESMLPFERQIEREVSSPNCQGNEPASDYTYDMCIATQISRIDPAEPRGFVLPAEDG